MGHVPTRLGQQLTRLIPPTPLSRRLATQSLLFATGEGTFMTGSAVFFTQVVGLRATRVGLGLTVAAVAAFLVAYPMGRLTDRIGPKRMWALGALVQALMFAVWPFIDGFTGYLAMIVVVEIFENAAEAGRNAYVLNVMPQKERIETQAYLYSSLNVGFTLGAIIGGVALALDDLAVMRWLPLFTMVIGLVNAVRIRSLPDAPHDLHRRVRGGPQPAAAPGPGPLRNPGWMLVSLFNGTLWTNQVLLNVVIPLWLVQETDSPHWLLAWLFGTNTVLCIVLPAYTSQGVRSVGDALRRVRYSAGFFVLSCLITMVTHSTVGLLTVVLVWLGHVTVTGAELAVSSASWTFQAKLMDSRRRGEYGGVAEVFATLGKGWAPAAYTFLAMGWHPPGPAGLGWLVIGAIVLAATLGMHPAAHAAERFLDRHGLAEQDATRPGADAGTMPEPA